MDKLTITYKPLRKDAHIEVHRENKFIVFRKNLDQVSIEDVIALAVDVFEKHRENGVIIYFNGTPADFNKLKKSTLSKLTSSIYHEQIYENIENRLGLIEACHLEIQSGPYPLSEEREREYIKYLSQSDILGTGYCLFYHLCNQSDRLQQNLIYDNNLSYEFVSMLNSYLSWINYMIKKLYDLTV